MPTLTSLSRQFDAALNQFKALDLGTTPGGGCCPEPYDPKKPYYPSIHIYDKPDSMEDIPEDGTALVKYKVTSRSTNERNGKKRHSLSLDVLSFDPQGTKKEDAKKKADGKAVAIAMSNGEGRMTEFARGDQTMRALKKFTYPKGKNIEEARDFIPLRGERAASRAAQGLKLLRKEGIMKRKKIGLRESGATLARLAHIERSSQFSEFSRPRDGDGQFVANVTGGADPVTMRQAYGPDPKKSRLLAPGAAAAALGMAGLLGTKAGRVMAVKGAKGVSRSVRRAVTGIDRKLKGRDTARYPVMGSKVVRDPGFGETLLRQRMRGD